MRARKITEQARSWPGMRPGDHSSFCSSASTMPFAGCDGTAPSQTMARPKTAGIIELDIGVVRFNMNPTHNQQASKGCYFDFMKTEFGGKTADPVIN